MGILFSITSCLLFYIINFNKKIMQSFIKSFSLLWFLILTLYYFNQDIFGPISNNLEETFLIFFYGVVISYYIFYCFFNNIPGVSFKKTIPVKLIYILSFILFLISTAKFLYYLSTAGGLSQFRTVFLDDRISLNIGTSFPVCACAYLCAKVEGRVYLSKSLAFIMIFLSLISTSKIFIIISLIYISGIYKKGFKFKFRVIVTYLLLGLILFALTHIILDKLAGGSKGIFYSLYFTFLGYFLGGFAVFQNVLDGLVIEKYKTFTDLIIRNNENAIGFTDSSWVRTGEWLGNVYSGFTPWYNTYGNGGILLLAFLIGIIYSLIYSFSNRNFFPFIYLKAFSIYPMVFFIFSDTIFASKLMWLAFLLCSILLAFIKINEKKSSYS